MGADEWVWSDWLTGRVPNLVGTRGVCTINSAARSPFSGAVQHPFVRVLLAALAT